MRSGSILLSEEPATIGTLEAPGVRPAHRNSTSVAPQPPASTLAAGSMPFATPDDGIDSIPSTFYCRYGKRTIDLIGGVLLLVLCSPILLIAAIWITRDSPGGPLFIQTRVGHRRRPFSIYKLRTMVLGAEAMIETDSELKQQYKASWKLDNDPRTTRCGHHLRKWSIDELPQLINVVRGEMSLVGPRPYMPHELEEEFGDHAAKITSIKPGMTGLWQTSGRSKLTPDDRIRLDKEYVDLCCFWQDVRIVAKTVKVVSLRHGAH